MSRNVTDLHPTLQAKVEELKALCRQNGIEIGISECLRTVAEQDALYAQGRTTSGRIVTNCKGSSYSSMHQWGVAFDFYLKMDVDGDGVISDDAFNNSTGLFEKVGALGKKIGLEWGGDWTIKDRPHLQLPDWGSTASKLKATYGTPDKFFATWGAGSTATVTYVKNSPTIYSHKYIIAILQSGINTDLERNIKIDGFQGPITFANCPTLSTATRNKYPNIVRAYQMLITAAGYPTGDSDKTAYDGDFYLKCKTATINYQREVVKLKNPDGEATRKKKTWSHLLRLS